MAQTIKKYQIIQKVSDSDSILIHPETEAGVVGYDNTVSQLNAENVKDAIDELKENIDDITGGGVVTGVKGSEETTFRTGKVSLSAANVGAEEEGAVDTHNSSTSAHSDIRTSVTAAQNRADAAYSLAEGRVRAVSFETLAAAKTALSAAAKTDYKVGDNIYIVAKDTPDYWVSKVNDTKSGDFGYFTLSELESEKVDLSDYQKITDNTLPTTSKTVVGAIGEVKTTADSASSAATANTAEITKIKNGTTKVKASEEADSATSAEKAAKWTTARTVTVTVGSGKKSDASTDITASGNASIDGSANKEITLTLGDSGVTAGTYSAVKVNAKGIAVAGAQIIEVGTTGQDTPSSSLATGGIFFKAI